MGFKKLTLTIELEGNIDDDLTVEIIKDALQNGGDPNPKATNPRYFDAQFRRNLIRASICNGVFSVTTSEMVRPDLLVNLGREIYNHYKASGDLEIITGFTNYGDTILVRVLNEVHTWVRKNYKWSQHGA